MAATVEALANQALAQIGYPRRIADIYEGSPAAIVAIEIYSQTRDAMLRAEDWAFARGNLALTLLKGPPPPGGYNPGKPWSTLYPSPGWLYEYAYPSDCLELRAILKPPGAMPSLDPRPSLWQIVNDPTPIVTGGVATGPAARVILTNRSSAVAIYRRQVTNLLLWEPGAIAALVETMAKKLSADPRLAASPDTMKTLPQEAVIAAAAAQQHRG